MAYSMPGRMNVLRIFIFCYSDAGDNSKAMLHFFNFWYSDFIFVWPI